AHRDAALVVEHGPEGGPVVGRLPDPARRGRDEERLGGTRDADHARDAAHHVSGPNIAPAETGEECGVEGDAVLRGEWCRYHREDGHRRPHTTSHDGLIKKE